MEKSFFSFFLIMLSLLAAASKQQWNFTRKSMMLKHQIPNDALRFDNKQRIAVQN